MSIAESISQAKKWCVQARLILKKTKSVRSLSSVRDLFSGVKIEISDTRKRSDMEDRAESVYQELEKLQRMTPKSGKFDDFADDFMVLGGQAKDAGDANNQDLLNTVSENLVALKNKIVGEQRTGELYKPRHVAVDGMRRELMAANPGGAPYHVPLHDLLKESGQEVETNGFQA